MLFLNVQAAVDAVVRFAAEAVIIAMLSLGFLWLLVRAAEEGMDETRQVAAGTWEEVP